jgi:hypothetical protein
MEREKSCYIKNMDKTPTTDGKVEAMKAPYVVSGDIQGLVGTWAQQKGFTLPPPDYFAGARERMAQHMKSMFPRFEYVPEDEMRDGIRTRAEKYGLPVISLDAVYFTARPQDAYMSLTRTVHKDDVSIDRGLRVRQGDESFLKQVTAVAGKFAGKEIVLVDDVVFSGSLVLRIMDVLQARGITVKALVAGVGIQDGLDKIQSANPALSIDCVRTYPKVIDQVCERDFFPGALFSGRSVADDERGTGVPYLGIGGLPEQWASIPQDKVASFTRFCIGETAQLFQAIEAASGKSVLCSDITRPVIGFPTDETPFVDALRNAARNM